MEVSLMMDGSLFPSTKRRQDINLNQFEQEHCHFITIHASNVPIGDHFPIELGFCITIAKAQGRTLHRLILSLSEHPQPFLRFKWEQVYTAISRVRARECLTLLLYMGNRNTLSYLSDLKKDVYTASYFAGFVPANSNGSGAVSYWHREVAARAAGFTT